MIPYPPRTRLLALVIAAMLTACTQSASNAPTQLGTEAAASTPASSRTEAPAAAESADALPLDDLKQLAALALRNQQLHTPAGANAIEYYLALRQRAPKPDAMVESALFDLAPYAVIAAEQALSSADLDTAARLRDLIQRIDRSAPSLPRLDEKMAEGQHEKMLAQQRAREVERVAAVAATAQVANPVAASASSKPSASPAAAAAPVKSVTKPPASTTLAEAEARAEPTPAAAPIAATPASTTPNLVAVRTPEPTFPPEAFRQRRGGSVEIEFQVDRDGRVSDVRVLRSSQRVFERNVVLAVRRWQFAPLPEPMTVRRNFNFNAPG